MDYYFTLEKGLNIQEALDVFEEFEQNHDPKWDLRTCVREYVYLYIEHFGNNNLPQLKMSPEQQKDVPAESPTAILRWMISNSLMQSAGLGKKDAQMNYVSWVTWLIPR